ncbi:VOC family protein [Nocardiopsis sp. RSe5-2]|uniref:VOC family protein n=1 Tax=Nocardiopsis endophytica TaxID=3018445 RepID=A0ABT4TWR6_9ACTN|nr:VOC family protein [Nocardiopsis endophytica]MDA2809138.1 VOC family protein [Nocardiopsis endophytica]
MTARLNPYISFAGNARQAMEFYRDVFGGELSISTYGEFAPPGTPGADNIMHSMLETPQGFVLMGSDAPPGNEHRPGNDVSVSISGDDDEALRGFWERLSEGGDVQVPFEKQMWGDVFGMCTDRFGVTWMVDVVDTSGA